MNRFDSLRPITRRQLSINYISPGLCGLVTISSASGSDCSVIEPLPVFQLGGPVLTVTETGEETLLLSWTLISHAFFYIIYRSTSPDGPFVLLTTVNGATSYTDTIFSPDVYYYRVTGVEPNAGETLPSNVAFGEVGANTRVTSDGSVRWTSEDEPRYI